MRKVLFSLVALLAIGCSKATDANLEKVTIRFTPYTMENMTKAYGALEGVTHLDIWFVEGTNVTTINQVSTDDGFGTISLVLNKTKTYNLYAIAHSATGAATFSDGVISFPDNKITGSFFYKTTFTPSSTALNCQMHRIVGQFRFEVTDVIPETVTQMKFTVYETGVTFNVADETSGNAIDKVTHYTSFTKTNEGGANFTVTILPDDQTTTASTYNIKVEALNANNAVVETRTFENVPIRANYKTVYRGTFLVSNTTTGSFLMDSTWSEYDPVNF